jgi:hypothetical protein
VPQEHRLTEAAANSNPLVWALPLLPAKPRDAVLSLPPAMQALNVAFWQPGAIEDLAITLLARSGVSSLDRRVFLSYCRKDCEPMARQLFDTLGRQNFDVFLDTIRMEPGVDFQSRLFESLADTSMVVLLQSANLHRSQWAMAEVEFALRNDLSLLILCLPGVEDKDVMRGARAGDQVVLHLSDLRRHHEKPPFALQAKALRQVVERIIKVHDQEQVQRLGAIRRRTIESLRRQGFSPKLAEEDAAIHIRGEGNSEHWRLLPIGRPPRLEDLHDASLRRKASDTEQSDTRIVVGPTGGIPFGRRRQLDWVVEGRNVRFCDVSMLDAVLQSLREAAQ